MGTSFTPISGGRDVTAAHTIIMNQPKVLRLVCFSVTESVICVTRITTVTTKVTESMIHISVEDQGWCQLPLSMAMIHRKAHISGKTIIYLGQWWNSTSGPVVEFAASCGWFSTIRNCAALHNPKPVGEGTSSSTTTAAGYLPTQKGIIETCGCTSKHVLIWTSHACSGKIYPHRLVFQGKRTLLTVCTQLKTTLCRCWVVTASNINCKSLLVNH